MIGAVLAIIVGTFIGMAMTCMVVVGDESNKPKACKDLCPCAGIFRCSECGCEFKTEDDDLIEPTLWVDGVATYPRFCPNCGARVMEAE